MESDVDAAAEEVLEVCELVRSRAAARRGRLAAVAGVGASSLMRAASWLREGMRVPEEGRSGFVDASWDVVVVVAGGEGVDIVEVGGQAQAELEERSLAAATGLIASLRTPVCAFYFRCLKRLSERLRCCNLELTYLHVGLGRQPRASHTLAEHGLGRPPSVYSVHSCCLDAGIGV